ncbi:hypothetical protein IAT38_008359 [Cryptococcus sp. DSM 104549]
MPQPTRPETSTDFTPASIDDRKSFWDIYPPQPEPANELSRYRILSDYAGVRISPLCLGAMSIGNQWTGSMGKGLDFEESCKLLDAFYEAGGNFIDTAGNYQDQQSEMILGEWMEKRGNRDEIVLATKFTTYWLKKKEGDFPGIRANYCGNHKKNLAASVEASLKKLRTSYIDLLYLHWWDYTTSVEEVMQSLNDLVKSGKVHYIGVSDAPAWVVARANEYARQHGLAQFSVYQGAWNLGLRDMERDIIPMCRAYGLGIAPYSVLGSGKFKTPEELKARGSTIRGGAPPTERELAVGQVLKEVAEEIGGNVALAHVGLAWARQMVRDVYPIVGGSSVEQLQSNIEALKIKLTTAQMDKLSNAVDFDWGFPYSWFGTDGHYNPNGRPNGLGLTSAAALQFTEKP